MTMETDAGRTSFFSFAIASAHATPATRRHECAPCWSEPNTAVEVLCAFASVGYMTTLLFVASVAWLWPVGSAAFVPPVCAFKRSSSLGAYNGQGSNADEGGDDATSSKSIDDYVLNVHGGKQTYGVNYFETYAPVVTWFAIRLMSSNCFPC